MVRELAHLAVLDGASHDELAALAKAGQFGEHDGNVHRQLVQTFCKNVPIDSVDIAVPCIDPKTSLEEETTASMFLPHMLFANLAKGYADKFSALFSTECLEQFWKGAEQTGDDRLRGHPITLKKDWRKTAIPIFLHGDGVEFQERDSLMAWSWGSLLSLFNSLDNHFLIAVFPKSCTSDNTWKPLMSWLVWSLKALQKGIHPSLDHDGKPFDEDSIFFPLKGQPLTPYGLRCTVWSIQGDHEFFSNVLNLPHWNNMNPCWECDCVKDETIPEKHFRTIRPSLQNFVLVDTRTALANPASSHPVFTIPGVSQKMVRGDGLHILFTKGMYAHLLGSVLHYLCWKEGRGVQRVQPCKRLAIIFDHIQIFYRANGTATRLTNLKLSMFTKETKPHKNWAFLGTKGAECKHLAPALLSFCKKALDVANNVDQHIIASLDAMCSLVDVIDGASMFLSPVEYGLALEKAELFLDNYDWLNLWAKGQDRRLFHIVIKFHMFWHLIQNSQFLNPRFVWCFKSEDFVGKVSRLTHSVSMAVRSTRLSLKVTPKYRLLLHLRLTREGFNLSLDELEE